MSEAIDWSGLSSRLSAYSLTGQDEPRESEDDETRETGESGEAGETGETGETSETRDEPRRATADE